MVLTSDQVAAISIVSGMIFVIVSFVLYSGYYKNGEMYNNSSVFLVKKWLYIFEILALNIAGCVMVYYVRNLQVLLYIMIVFKSKDLLMSVMFVFNMIYRYIFVDANFPRFEMTDEIKKIVSFIPVYNESLEQLKRTVDSVVSNETQPNYTMVCIVSDGKNHYEGVFDKVIVTGHDLTYKSWLGNVVSVKIHYGTRMDKHIVLIEKDTNVGKKDSIILVNQIFNSYIDNLDEITKSFKQEVINNIRIVFGISDFDYLFTTDADTVVDKMSINCLLDSILKNNAVASCGIVDVDKTSGNVFWNELQNFQYLYGQYVRRTCEDIFSQVLCLPGCISMFRLNESSKDALLMYSTVPNENDFVVSNVQYLGTDRRLTSSFVYSNERHLTVMDTRCHGYTTPPQNLKNFFSQRRRWMQNTYFNTMINIIAPNVDILLRFFCLIDYVRMSLVYFRLFNSLFFVYVLAVDYSPHNVLDLLPYIIILAYPVVFFFVYAIFNGHLRQQWFKLFVFWLINKLFIIVSNVVVFTIMLWNIGIKNWSN
jgi:cellulose synthase/poly-beta-1,6-N-acetylglucosamine synthase-like glycosyltransferase